MPHIVIIGGGISGLATANHLQVMLPAAQITVLEASNRLGGTIWTERRDGFQFELGANGFLDNNRSTLELCERLGLRDELVLASAAARRRYLFLGDRLQRLPEGLASFLGTPLLSWRSKWAIMTERFRKASVPMEDESVHDFVTRRTTAQIAETFGDALVTGIYAGDPKLLSMAAAFPRVAALEREHGSVRRGMAVMAKQQRAAAAARGESYQRGGRLLSLSRGLRRLIETLADVMRRPPVLGVRVHRIRRAEAGWRVQAETGEEWSADAVVLACPAYVQADVVAGLDANLAECIREIPYVPAIVAALGYRREDIPPALDGFGYIAPQRTRRDVLGVQWCSSIFPNRVPPGMVLLRAMCGGWHRRDMLGWDDAKLLAAVRAELRLAMRIESAPAFHQIVRWEQAIPQYTMGHLERVAGIETAAGRHPGLFLTGNAYHGVALNDCTEQAVEMAGRVAGYCRRVSAESG